MVVDPEEWRGVIEWERKAKRDMKGIVVILKNLKVFFSL